MSSKVASDHESPGPRWIRRSIGEARPSSASPPKQETPHTSSWRQLIKVHPAAELFPMMSDDELALLGRDIAKHGLREHLVLWTPYQPQDFKYNNEDEYLLDGRNRLEAIERGIIDPKDREAAILLALRPHYGHRPDALGGAIRLYGNIDPYEFVISLNLRRRHLTRMQQRRLLEGVLRANPERSNRDIAKLAKVSDKTVTAARGRLEATAEIPQLDKTTGADGKARPTRRDPQPSSGKTSAAQLSQITLSEFSKSLHRLPAETLEEVIRLARAEHARITQLAPQRRIELARGYLQALDVSLEQLSRHDV